MASPCATPWKSFRLIKARLRYIASRPLPMRSRAIPWLLGGLRMEKSSLPISSSSAEGSTAVAVPVPLLELRGLSAGYGRGIVVRDIQLRVVEGELVTLVGPNGAGKTTVLRAVMRLLESSGEMTFRGVNVSRLTTPALARLGMILVQEGRGPFGQMSAPENLLLGAYTAGADRRQSGRRVDTA